MFKEHNFALWGKKCECGEDCSILQNSFHPWMENEFVAKIKCDKCGKLNEVNQKTAGEYYSERICTYYRDVHGVILDLGCGGGFLSEYLLKNNLADYVYALDVEKGCIENIEELNKKYGSIEFIHSDIKDMAKHLDKQQFDYLISRDVFMFVEATDRFFDDITKLVRKGIRQMGWYVTGNERMKNKLQPDDIAEELKKRGWSVEIEYLDWYKYGYFIKADRI